MPPWQRVGDRSRAAVSRQSQRGRAARGRLTDPPLLQGPTLGLAVQPPLHLHPQAGDSRGVGGSEACPSAQVIPVYCAVCHPSKGCRCALISVDACTTVGLSARHMAALPGVQRVPHATRVATCSLLVWCGAFPGLEGGSIKAD